MMLSTATTILARLLCPEGSGSGSITIHAELVRLDATCEACGGVTLVGSARDVTAMIRGHLTCQEHAEVEQIEGALCPVCGAVTAAA